MVAEDEEKKKAFSFFRIPHRVTFNKARKDARVIFGAVIDEKIKKGEIKITVIATGFNHNGTGRSNQLVLEPEINATTMEIERKKITKENKREK